MKLLNYQGLWLLLFLPLIIILFFKKEQRLQYEVSSIKLWDEVLKEVKGLKINKINNYLSLIMQMIVGFLIILSLCQPQLIRKNNGKEITLLLDCSISMKSIEDNKSHFEMAKDKLKNYISELRRDTKINLVLMKNDWEIYIKNGSKNKVLENLKNIHPSDECLNLDKIQDINNIFKGKKILITDKNLKFGDNFIKIGKKFDNVGIIDTKYDYYTNYLIYRIKNYSPKTKEVFLSIGNGEEEKDIEKVKLLPNEEKDLNFLNSDISDLLCISIKQEDMLLEDNKVVVPIGDEYKEKIIFIGENSFLENVLKSIPSISYSKKDKLNAQDKGYDLYIINDNIDIPQNIRKENIWYLNPDSKLIEGELKGVKKMKFKNEFFPNKQNIEDIYVENTKYLKQMDDFIPVLNVEDRPITIYKIEDGKKVLYSTLNLTKTNFGMTPYFPIFINNMLERFLDGQGDEYKNAPLKLISGDQQNILSNTESFNPKLAIVDLQQLFIIVAIIFLIIEWKVYNYEQYR